ncbi:bi-domain-containing oxidoreductase [Ignavibacteria bacterium]|nr:bi-domain-containing oxidoreductase [Bacteroidota bacterium]MCZ2132527.1 bi-domain-containing oxidoreductase [Bacteroidota bacterium]
MLQVLQYQKNGEMLVAELPQPQCRAGGILVRTVASLISAGTERSSVAGAQSSMLERARSQPEAVKQIIENIKKEGLIATYERVKSKLESYKMLGYSASGIVVESRCPEFATGDRVACAGAQFAHHAEYISVPKNLAVRIPDKVSFEDACYTTLGAIAMQGVRQADVRLGETVAVIGLGLLGQITVQLLKASGCRTVGLDINEALFPMASEFGCEATFVSKLESASAIKSFTRGLGTDAVIITASTDSDEPMLLALDIARKKSPVVVVGAVPMNVPRSPFYEKELELRISCSYGPGRYDPIYEENGIDYPSGYVRWTENRNMGAFLDLIAAGSLRVESMTTHRIAINDAVMGYDLITGKIREPYLGIVLNYPESAAPSKKCIKNKEFDKQSSVGLGLVGAGSFAQAMLLPPLKAAGVDFAAVSTSTPANAKSAAHKFGFAQFSTDSSEVIADKNVSFVVIASRHDSHARYVEQALIAGKPAFVEKPLAINREQLDAIDEFAANGRIMVGFNRRFSAPFKAIKEFFGKRSDPMTMVYRVNAGSIPKANWIQDTAQGGRIIGEGCHFFDCMTYLCGALPIAVYAESISGANREIANHDIVSITVKFTDGSVGTLHYFANGDASLGKEYCEVFCENSVAIMDNFTKVSLHRGKKQKILTFDGSKGHREEIEATVKAVKSGTPMPIGYAEIRAVTLATFAAEESLATGNKIPIM